MGHTWTTAGYPSEIQPTERDQYRQVERMEKSIACGKSSWQWSKTVISGRYGCGSVPIGHAL